MNYSVEYYEKEDGTYPAEEFILSQDKKMQLNAQNVIVKIIRPRRRANHGKEFS